MWTWMLACGPDDPQGPDDGVTSTPHTAEPGPDHSTPAEDVLPLAITVRPSAYVPSAFVAAWDGPAGTAELRVDGELRVTRPVEDGAGSLPIALLPPGGHAAVVTVRAADGAVYRSEPTDLEIPAPPIGAAQVGSLDPGRSEVGAGGYVVVHTYTPAGQPDVGLAVIYDPLGRVVWWLPPAPGHRVIRAKPSADGRAVWVLMDEGGDDDWIDRVALDGETLVRTATPDLSHDVAETDDGLAWIGYAYGPAGSMREYPSQIVASDAIRVAPLGGESTQRWSFLDDWVAEPWSPCSHATPGGFVPGAVEWTHANSLIPDPGGDGWWLLGRYVDALVHVGGDGQRRSELGGLHATLRPTDRAPFLHGHMSHAWSAADGTHLLVFDNQTHAPAPVVSRVTEILVDEGAGTWKEVWSMADPLGRATGFLGDARRLPGGNTLVTWTARDEIVEYTASGDDVWHLSAPMAIGRATFVRALTP